MDPKTPPFIRKKRVVPVEVVIAYVSQSRLPVACSRVSQSPLSDHNSTAQCPAPFKAEIGLAPFKAEIGLPPWLPA